MIPPGEPNQGPCRFPDAPFSDSHPGDTSDGSSGQVVAAVCVTYGDRWHLATRTLDAARREGCAFAVLIDNGCPSPVSQAAVERYGEWIRVHRLAENSGSSGGFSEGIARALQEDCSHLLLLDDDNELQAGCLAKLASEISRPSASAKQGLAALAFRPGHQTDLAAGMPAHRCQARSTSFLGFHFADLVFKVWRRINPTRDTKPGETPSILPVDIAPYSGLLLDRDLVLRIGLPRKDFLLYSDDSEFTWRITASGGRIHLVRPAILRDLDTSWNVERGGGSSFDTWLMGGSDLRVFYACRNRIAFEIIRMEGTRLAWIANAAAYLSILGLLALQKRRVSRWRLILRAVRDGYQGRLGEHPEYPLGHPG